MNSQHEGFHLTNGLEDVIVEETQISSIDGKKGVLSYRGFLIENIVEKKSPIETIWLLLFGNFPTKEQVIQLNNFMLEHTRLEKFELEILKNIPKNTHPMLMLQSMIPILNCSPQSKWEFGSDQKDAIEGLIVISKISALVAAFYRILNGLELLETDCGSSFYENLYYLFHGKKLSSRDQRILDITQILQMEHGFSASTYAARITASTLAPVQSSISAAIGSLFGRLHGGADEATIRMVFDIANIENVEPYIQERLRKKIKIMGMGHRVYKTIDPRATILRSLASELCMGTEFENIYKILHKVEKVMEKEMQWRNLQVQANIDFYKGAVFFALQIPPMFFTPFFSTACSVGYLAHYLETSKKNKIIRPRELYTGHPIREIH